ncbi:RNA polymerase sigma factor [Serpentinicella alkaliphila]|uniref:RNA polymerase sigma-70 factor (ECF subfamily) n=1 Tax=Serpentinicella alkaliphila TaxID=1734049 RepID=A0A4R2TBP0_9FIRM|nr:RNA polymerase sigma factor [Serpentinicella alkaliphila]QUH25803.1 RNA polymerase sigma factor [Serpentinicella alkaliphila]TCP99815.1 RNA polymerase sigma-70 factor (ECF subfamily) [Serpentinicella alkaliphila]
MKSDAMDRAYRKYYKELYLYALSLCRQEDMAKDLVSETFYKAFITSNVPEGSFKYWLFRILKNHFIDLKRKDHECLTLDYYKYALSHISEKGPAKSVLQKERDQRIYQLLIRLEPENYREVLYLYYYGEMSIRDISITIDRSESHTKTTLYRARKKLGKELKEDSYEF